MIGKRSSSNGNPDVSIDSLRKVRGNGLQSDGQSMYAQISWLSIRGIQQRHETGIVVIEVVYGPLTRCSTCHPTAVTVAEIPTLATFTQFEWLSGRSKPTSLAGEPFACCKKPLLGVFGLKYIFHVFFFSRTEHSI